MCHPEIILEQGKKSVRSVLIVFGRLIRRRSTMHRLENSPERQTILWIHFLNSSFSAVSLVLSGFLNLLFSVHQPKASCFCDWITSGIQMTRGQTEIGRGGLELQLHQMKNEGPSDFWLLQFSTQAALLPLSPPQNCLGSGVKVNAEKGERKEKGWFPQSLSFKSSFPFLKPELKEFSWVSLCLFHNAYFWILMLWDQAGDTWGEK